MTIAAEVARVQAYFDSGGDSLVREITAQREQASSDLEFENAAALHARVEKLKPVLSQLPEIVHRIDQLTAIMVQPSAVPESVVFFFVDRGLISGPLTFSIQAAEHTKSQSMESRIQAALATIPPAEPKSAARNHGASRTAQTLVLPQHQSREKFSLRTPRVDCLCADWCAALRVSIAEKNQRLLHCRARRDGRRLPPWPSETRRGFAYKTF